MYRVLQKYSPTEHPLLKKFIGNIEDKDFLEKLANYEGYWNWIGPELTPKEIDKEFRKYVKEESDDTGRIRMGNDEGDDDEIDPAGLEKEWFKLNPNISVADKENNHSINFLLKARLTAKKIFWLIYLDKIEEAGILLNDIQAELTSARSESLKLLIAGNAIGGGQEVCLFSLSFSEIVDAYSYIFDGLEAYMMIKNGEYEESWSAVKGKPEFNDFPKKAQVLIVYFKLGFLSGGRKYFVDIKDTVEKLVELDPSTSHWYRGLYFYSRMLRRQESLYASHSEEETHAVLKAYTLDPNSPSNIGNLCKDMAEVFRNKEKDPNNWPLEYGDMTFMDQAEMYQNLKERAKEIMKQREQIISAKMEKPFLALVAAFSSMLPFHCRDLRLAEKCVDCALEIDPKCTIALHRKALLIMKQDRSSNARDRAEEILRQINDEFAFYPFYDLLSLLLRDLNKNKDELQDLFVVNIAKTEIWNTVEISKLYFLKGCLNFMCEEFAQAFDDWIECFTLDSTAQHFDELKLSGHRFSWSKRILNISNVYHELQNLDKAAFAEDKWVIFDTMSEIITKLRYPYPINNYQGSAEANADADPTWRRQGTSSETRGPGNFNSNWRRGHRVGGRGQSMNINYIPRGGSRGRAPHRGGSSS